MLTSRLFYGTIMICLALAILIADGYMAPYFPLLAIAVSWIGWVASREFCALVKSLPLALDATFLGVGTVGILLANWWPHVIDPAAPPRMGAPLAAFVWFSFCAFFLSAWRYQGPGRSTFEIAGHIFALFYIGVLGGFVVQLRWLADNPAVGSLAMTLAIFAAKVGDIGAFFVGRWLGKNKLAPVLSPGKTLEGSLGGLMTSILFCVAFVWLAERFVSVQLFSLAFAAGFGLLVGLAGQVGDLMESLIKRDCAQKDASAAIPGFGGLLDVIDSVLFAGPVAFLLFRLAAWLTQHWEQLGASGSFVVSV